MKIILRRNHSSSNLFLNIIIIILCFASEDILILGPIDSDVMVTFRYILQFATLIALAVYVLCKTKTFKASRVKIFVYLLCTIVASSIINFDLRPGYVFLFLILTDTFLILTVTTPSYIFKIFTKCMLIISTWSLVLYGLQVLFPGLMQFLPSFKNVNNCYFYFGGLSNARYMTDSFIRNYGPFREPGVFQAYICLALMFTLYCDKDITLFKVMILIASLLTTFSTTGYLALICILGAMFFSLVLKESLSITQKNVFVRTLKLSILAFFYLLLFTNLLFMKSYGSVFGKFSYKSASTNARLASVFVCLYMMFMRPILGCGISYVDANFTRLGERLLNFSTKHNTNTLFIQGARFGVPFLIFYIYRIFKFIDNTFITNKFSRFCLLMGYLCLLFGENFSYIFIFTLPLFVNTRTSKANL